MSQGRRPSIGSKPIIKEITTPVLAQESSAYKTTSHATENSIGVQRADSIRSSKLQQAQTGNVLRLKSELKPPSHLDVIDQASQENSPELP